MLIFVFINAFVFGKTYVIAFTNNWLKIGDEEPLTTSDHAKRKQRISNRKNMQRKRDMLKLRAKRGDPEAIAEYNEYLAKQRKYTSDRKKLLTEKAKNGDEEAKRKLYRMKHHHAEFIINTLNDYADLDDLDKFSQAIKDKREELLKEEK